MNEIDLMERRAERGVPRGAANVWGDAVIRTDRRNPSPTMWFRLTIAAVAVVIIAVITIPRGVGWQLNEENPAIDSAPIEQVEDTGPKPWILVADMELVDTFTADDRRLATRSTAIIVSSDEDDVVPRVSVERRAVFVSEVDPFDWPIVTAELSSDGSVSVGSSNGTPEHPLPISVRAEFDGSEWLMTEGLEGYELAAEVDFTQPHMLPTDQFDFANGDETATVQIEPDDGYGIWLWVARQSKVGLVPQGVSTLEIFDQPGLRMSNPGTEGDDVFWVDQGQLYRVTAGVIDGDTHLSRSTETVIPQLRRASGAELAAAIEAIPSPSIIPTILTFLVFLLSLWWIGRALWDRNLGQGVVRLVCVVAVFVVLGPVNWLTLSLWLLIIVSTVGWSRAKPKSEPELVGP